MFSELGLCIVTEDQQKVKNVERWRRIMEKRWTPSAPVCSLVFSVAHTTAFISCCSPGVVDRVDTRPWHFVTAMQPKVHVLDFVLYFLDLAVQQFNWFLVVSLRALDITHFDRKKISKQWIEKERTRLWIKVCLLILKMHFLRILDCIMWGVNFCFFRIFKTQMILFHIAVVLNFPSPMTL